MSRKVKYISLELDRDSKEKLQDLVSKVVDKKDFCYLKYKGGDVTKKAHLTLLFGLPLSVVDDDILHDFERAAGELRILKASRLEIFRLGKARCSALVLRVENDHLAKWHKYFESKFGLDPYFDDKREFKAHITLAYVKKNFDLKKTRLENLELKVGEIKLKTFISR